MNTLDDAYKGGNEGFAIHGSGLKAGEGTLKHQLEKNTAPIVVSSMSTGTKTAPSQTPISLTSFIMEAGTPVVKYSFDTTKLLPKTHAQAYGVAVINKILGKTLSNGLTLQA